MNNAMKTSVRTI